MDVGSPQTEASGPSPSLPLRPSDWLENRCGSGSRDIHSSLHLLLSASLDGSGHLKGKPGSSFSELTCNLGSTRNPVATEKVLFMVLVLMESSSVFT